MHSLSNLDNLLHDHSSCSPFVDILYAFWALDVTFLALVAVVVGVLLPNIATGVLLGPEVGQVQSIPVFGNSATSDLLLRQEGKTSRFALFIRA